MTTPVFSISARYQGNFIPGITTTNWFYSLIPIFPGGTTGTTITNSTGPVANSGLNGLDIVNVQWTPQAGAIAYQLFRAAGSAPATTGAPWANFTCELGVKDVGYPSTYRS